VYFFVLDSYSSVKSYRSIESSWDWLFPQPAPPNMFKMAPSSLVSLLFMAAVLGPVNANSLERRDLEAPEDLENEWEYQGCYL
jgi:hypothetical protein